MTSPCSAWSTRGRNKSPGKPGIASAGSSVRREHADSAYTIKPDTGKSRVSTRSMPGFFFKLITKIDYCKNIYQYDAFAYGESKMIL
jgi:hypothetical protein